MQVVFLCKIISLQQHYQRNTLAMYKTSTSGNLVQN